jgi:hypothetical protein
MNIADYLEVTESRCRVFHPNTVSMVESVELMTRAIAFCRDQKIRKLLVDASGLTQLSPPTLVDRFLMVEDWARAASGMVIVAMVWPPKLIHPQKFGIRVAADLGLRGDVFTSKDEATAWLLAQTDTHTRAPRA